MRPILPPALAASLATSAIVMISGCAPTAPLSAAESEAQRQCFYPFEVQNFRADSRTVYLRTRNDAVYELSAPGFCSDLDFANTLVIGPDLGTSSRLCVGDNARIAPVGGGARPGSCRVRIEQRLSPEQIAALPGRSRP